MTGQRIRSNSDQAFGGTARYKTGVIFGDSGLNVFTGASSITDFVYDGDCHPLLINSWSMDPGRLNGETGQSLFFDYVPTIYRNQGNFPHINMLPISPTDGWLANNALARTNPSRAHVDVPVMVLELPEILSLIKELGGNLIRKIGQANLNLQFGVLPLVDDLAKIVDFQDQFGRRAQQLERLQGSGGYRRTVDQGTFTGRNPTLSKTIQSEGGAVINKICTAMTTEICRSHVRWFPPGDFKTLSAKSRSLLAHRIMHGFTRKGWPNIDMLTLWEIIPWSFLIDYAFDISGFFRATRNIIQCQTVGAIVMRETKTTWFIPRSTHTYLPGNWKLSVGEGEVKRSTKTRKLVGATPFAGMPFLTSNQMGIVASLAVTRGKR